MPRVLKLPSSLSVRVFFLRQPRDDFFDDPELLKELESLGIGEDDAPEKGGRPSEAAGPSGRSSASTDSSARKPPSPPPDEAAGVPSSVAEALNSVRELTQDVHVATDEDDPELASEAKLRAGVQCVCCGKGGKGVAGRRGVRICRPRPA